MNIIEKYKQVYGSPFLVGVFMGINAIKDVALFVDGPDCIFFKADFLYKTHDLYSTLKQASVDTRIYFSGVMPNKMIRGYDDNIKRKLGFIAQNNKFNLGVVTYMPVTGLLATQYNNSYDDFNKDFLFIPSLTDKFRIDGYSTLLKGLAKFIKLDKDTKKKKFSIGIVGFLFDRNEGDCLGNLGEIKRLLGLLGIEVNSIWFDGSNYADLKKIENSEIIVSFNYGLHASKILSKKLDIEMIELEVPFGLLNTINFIVGISTKLGINKDEIDDVISKEIKIIKQKVDLLDSKIFINKNYIYAGDPFLEQSIIDIGDYLGMNHIKTYNYTGSKEAKESDIKVTNIDIVIGNSDFNMPGFDYLKFEFGFPSYSTHFLQDRPYMGFKGFLYFVEGLYNSILKENIKNEEHSSFFN